MSVAQTRAARRKFRDYYRKGEIGRPYYKVKSVARMERMEVERREKQKATMARSKGKKK